MKVMEGGAGLLSFSFPGSFQDASTQSFYGSAGSDKTNERNKNWFCYHCVGTHEPGNMCSGSVSLTSALSQPTILQLSH
jgi:hypothetical protein